MKSVFQFGRAFRSAAIAALTVFFVAGYSVPARAQFIGYTSPQTVQQELANLNTLCTGTQQLFTVQNLGQNQHFATLTLPGVATQTATMSILGVDASGFTNTISETVILAQSGTGTVYGTGYFPIVRISVTCSSAAGTFGLSYSGTSANTPQISGNYQSAQQVKRFKTAANATLGFFVQTPFGSSDAFILAEYTVAAVANSTLTISCNSVSLFGTPTQWTFPLANATITTQFFKIPPGKCFQMFVAYNSGGATAGSINFDILFDQPGTSNDQVANYVHIAGTTATAAKPAPGVLTTLTIGTPAAGTVTLHDLALAGCAAVPATEIVGVFTAIAGSTPITYPLNLFFRNGICVKASAIMDLTVGVQ